MNLTHDQARHWQFDDQPRAAACYCRGAVLGINPPAGALDDLAGDGKPQAGIAAEGVAGPLGIETLEDGFQIVGGMPGPSSSTVTRATISWRRAVTVTVPPGGLKDTALSIRLRNTWPSRSSRPRTINPGGNSSLQHELHGMVSVGHTIDSMMVDSRRDSATGGGFARQFGVQPRGIGNVGDQPVDAFDVAAHDAQQRARLSSSLARPNISTALASEVSGFLSSCATSAAKRSMASMRS